MPNTPPISITEPLRQAFANALSVSPLALASLPEPIRQQMLEDATRNRTMEKLKAFALSAKESAVDFFARDGHRLIPDTGDLFVCCICAKRFRLAP